MYKAEQQTLYHHELDIAIHSGDDDAPVHASSMVAFLVGHSMTRIVMQVCLRKQDVNVQGSTVLLPSATGYMLCHRIQLLLMMVGTQDVATPMRVCQERSRTIVLVHSPCPILRNTIASTCSPIVTCRLREAPTIPLVSCSPSSFSSGSSSLCSYLAVLVLH